MILRPFLFAPTSCASYLFGCTSKGRLAVVDPHAELVDSYLEAADEVGAPIVAVLETHVQADHVSGLPALVERTRGLDFLSALGPVAEAAARLVTTVEPARIRRCSSEQCGAWFVDRSKGNRRRWCSMAGCGNRQKAAVHRSRSG